MNDGMFITLRDYAAEQSSLLRQLLEAQNKTNEMLSQLVAKPAMAQPAAFTLADNATKGDPGIKATPKKGK